MELRSGYRFSQARCRDELEGFICPDTGYSWRRHFEIEFLRAGGVRFVTMRRPPSTREAALQIF
jgi:hypothetical protein